MGSLKKVAKIIIPLALMFVGAGVFGINAGTWSLFGHSLSSFSAMQGLMLGNMLTGFGKKKKAPEGQSGAVAYGLGAPSNVPDPRRPVPVIYGETRVDTGNLIYMKRIDENKQDRVIALCEGEVTSVSDIMLNGRPVTDYAECTATAYTGTAGQTNDSRTGGYKGTLKRLAYVAATIKASEAMRGEPVISALVKGRKVEVWTGAAFEVQYSTNPVWIARDILLNVAGMPQALVDAYFDDMVSAADYFDEIIPDSYDLGPNVALASAGASISGPATNTARVIDGSMTVENDGSYIWVPQDETLHEHSTIDLGRLVYTNYARMQLYDGNEAQFKNYKVEASANGSDWTTLVDKTGTEADYSGRQDIEFTAANYRYFKISGAGNQINGSFNIIEFQVYELLPAKRATASVVVDSDRQVRDVIQDLCTSCGMQIVYAGDGFRISAERGDADVDFEVAESDMVEGEVSYKSLGRTELPNKVIVTYREPRYGYRAATVTAENTFAQAENGVITQEINLPCCVSASQASRMARQALAYAEMGAVEVTYTGPIGNIAMQPGDVVELTDAEAGWAGKEFVVQSVTRVNNTKYTITAQEYIRSIYDDEGAATHPAVPKNLLPEADKPAFHVINLTLTEGVVQPGDGTWVPTVAVTFDPPSTGPEWAGADVELKKTGGNYYVHGRADSKGEYEIVGLEVGVEYSVRVVSVSTAGIKSSLNTAPVATITPVGKNSPPDNVSGFNYSVGPGGLKLVWNTARDINNDLSYYEVRDGADWSSGTVIATDVRTTILEFMPTKRTYALRIKAFDRSGNESATATTLAVSIPAPTLASNAVTLIEMSDTTVLVDIDTPDNPYIIGYEVHANNNTFNPSKSTLKVRAGSGQDGKTVVTFLGQVDILTYVRVCAIDYLSYAVGDQFYYPSSELTCTPRLTEENDIRAGSVVTRHLSANGIDIGGSGNKAPYLRLINGASGVVGYLGKIVKGGIDYFGAVLESYFRLGPEATPYMEMTPSGLTMNFSSRNLMPNGGFDMIKATGAMGSDAGFVPEFTLSKSGAGEIYVRTKASYPDEAGTGKYLLQVRSGTTGYAIFQGQKMKVLPSTYYQVALKDCVALDPGATYIPIQIRAYHYNAAGTQTDYDTLYNGNYSTTTRNKRSFPLQTNSDTATIMVEVQVSASAANYSYYYCVDMQVTRGQADVPYTPPPIDPTTLPVGVVIGDRGVRIHDSGGAEVIRVGNLYGLPDGDAGTFADGVMGFWSKLSEFLIVNGSNEKVFGIDGVTEHLFASTPILDAWLEELHVGVKSSGVTTATASFPVTIAHGQSNIPGLMMFIRGVNEDPDPDEYSKWVQIPSSNWDYSTNNVFCTNFEVETDSTNIKVHAKCMHLDTTGVTVTVDEFATPVKTIFRLPNASGTLDTVYDKLQVGYIILREGMSA